MDQPRRQFLAETEDLIEQVFAALDELREQSNPQQQRRLIDEIFRHIHRIKGSAASFGFEGLAEIAHEFENLLSALRAEQLTLSDSVLDTSENAATALSESLRLATAGIIEPSRRDLFESLRGLTQTPAADSVNVEAIVAAAMSQLPTELSQALTEEEKRRLARRLAEGNSLCLVGTTFDIASFEEQFYSLKEKLAERGEVISTSPAVDPEQSEKINFRILFSSSANCTEVKSGLIGFPNLSVTEVTPAASLDAESPALEAKPTQYSLASRANFIRTDLDDLDQLISSTHDLFRLTTHTLDLAQSRLPGAEEQTLDQLAREIRRSFLRVEDALIGLRMVSLGPILQRAARAGRVAARLRNKQVDFEIVGSDLRLDKLLCDAIADPLVHLVRNAVDHGIETPEARVEAGKPQRGRVVIEAVNEGSSTRVRVIDDGGGVDAKAVSLAATELGIIDLENSLDMDRSLRLIFRPGFSTLATASAVSGRGVGLDIVETEVEQVGGEMRVSSKAGESSIFEIQLPISFSLLESTVVRAGENCYCLDARQVVKAEQIEAPEIAANGAGETLRSEKDVVPLVHLRELLGEQGSRATNGELSVITCELPERVPAEGRELSETGNGKRLIRLVVDDVAETVEVLVRNLGRYAGRWSGIVGATELSDGKVALVLDLPRLIASSR